MMAGKQARKEPASKAEVSRDVLATLADLGKNGTRWVRTDSIERALPQYRYVDIYTVLELLTSRGRIMRKWQSGTNHYRLAAGLAHKETEQVPENQ